MIESILRRIFRYSTAGPALTRYYICPHVKLHRIHSSDDDFHTHPWNGYSFIFGSYTEYTQKYPELIYVGARGPATIKHRRRWFNRVYANKSHKVEISKPVWTLFIHGNRVNENWAYGNSVKPWEGSDQEREKL